MQKLPSDLENPIDNFIYIIINLIAPYVYNIGLTPNFITTLGNICTVFFSYYFINRNYAFSSFFYALAYFFDCLDGFIARSYNMITVFGDYYDHISDVIRTLIYFYLFLTTNYELGITKIIIILFFIVLNLINLSHQEKYYNHPKQSQTLGLLNIFSLANNKSEAGEYLKYTRFFGSGTCILLMTLFIYFYEYKIERFFLF